MGPGRGALGGQLARRPLDRINHLSLGYGIVLFHAFNSGDPIHLANAPLPIKAASWLQANLNQNKHFQHTNQGQTDEGKGPQSGARAGRGARPGNLA